MRQYLKDYQAPAFVVSELHLNFDLHETRTLVTAIMKIKLAIPNLPNGQRPPLVLDGKNLILKSIQLNETFLVADQDYQKSETQLVIHSYPDREFSLRTQVEINPEANKSCEGLYLSGGIFTTQCEAEGFRSITYFFDRPDVMTKYTVEIEADIKKYPSLLANGNLVKPSQSTAEDRHKVTWQDPFKKPSYLFALVAGDLGVVRDTFVTKSGRTIQLEVYAAHGKQNRCYHALESLKKSMKWDEIRYGLEYDLDQFMIVSIDDFNMGAMENKGLNIFNSRLVLADPHSATDRDFDLIEAVVGHEYFHNWTGNRVTCRNWFELSLKEGLTVFRDQEFSADLHSKDVERIKAVNHLRDSQFAEDAGPNAHPVRPESCLSVDNFYTPTIYEKGAELIRMLQTMVGREGFRKGMDEYFRRHDGQAVTILNFVDAVSTANSLDLTQFKLWYSQFGTPIIQVKENYDANAKIYNLTLTQKLISNEKQPSPQPLHIPLRAGLIASDGKNYDLPLIHLRQNEQYFQFKDVHEKPVLSLNRDFSAPVKIDYELSIENLLHLIKYDSDGFNRWESLNRMLLAEIRRLIKHSDFNASRITNPSVIASLAFVLNDNSIDSEFKALMLQLPSEDILAQEEELLDAAVFKKAYQIFCCDFVESHSKSLVAIYEKNHLLNSPGARALKNQCLKYLISAEFPAAIEMANRQFLKAQNMTDKLAALAFLCQTESTEKESALLGFFNEWKQDAVVYNKWLQVQAQSKTSDCFERVQRLAQSEPFSFETPNNVYSLVGGFADNYFAMNLANGQKTYPWLCDIILQIDKKNPQVAARLCGSFNFVKKLPLQQKRNAEAEIKRLLVEPSLSRNARELLETHLQPSTLS